MDVAHDSRAVWHLADAYVKIPGLWRVVISLRRRGRADDSGNFESPRASDTPGTPAIVRGAPEDPPLRDAALAALSVLSQDRDGFFLMVEQGDIDWANHDNDFARMIGCTWDLNETVKAVVDFVNRPGDRIDWQNTLLIVTSDHSNSHLRLTRPLGRGDLPRQIVKTSDSACRAAYCGKYVYLPRW